MECHKIIPDCLRRKQMFKTGQNPRSWPHDYCSLWRWIPIVFWSRLNGHHTHFTGFSHNTLCNFGYAQRLSSNMAHFIFLLTIMILKVDFIWCHHFSPSSPPPTKSVKAQCEKYHTPCSSQPLILRHFSKHQKCQNKDLLSADLVLRTLQDAMEGRKEAWNMFPALKTLTTLWGKWDLQMKRHENNLTLSFVTSSAFRVEPSTFSSTECPTLCKTPSLWPSH